MRPQAATAPSISAVTARSSVTSQASDQTRSGCAAASWSRVSPSRLVLQAAAGGGGADAGAGRGGDHDDLAVEQAAPGRRAHRHHPRTGLGRPSARAAMMLRWISSDPP
jgi:hypothetical protein